MLMVFGLVNALAGFLVTPDMAWCWEHSLECHAQQSLLKLHEARWGAVVAAGAGGFVHGFWAYQVTKTEEVG